MAALQNKDGKFVMPSEQSGAEALAKATMPADMRVWLPDPEGEGSYPIATYTWMLFHKKYDDPKKAEAMQEDRQLLPDRGTENQQQNGLHPAARECCPRGEKGRPKHQVTEGWLLKKPDYGGLRRIGGRLAFPGSFRATS